MEYSLFKKLIFKKLAAYLLNTKAHHRVYKSNQSRRLDTFIISVSAEILQCKRGWPIFLEPELDVYITWLYLKTIFQLWFINTKVISKYQ